MTLLKFINVFILQWFFVRLTKCTETVVMEFTITEFSLMPDGSYAPSGKGKASTFEWYAIQFWIIPVTGWWSGFISLGTVKFKRISKRKEVATQKKRAQFGRYAGKVNPNVYDMIKHLPVK